MTKALGLAAQPGTGTLYAIVQTGGGAPLGNGGGQRRLATIDSLTASVTLGPVLADSLADIAFRADGTLYGTISNDGTAGGDVVIVNVNDGSLTPTGIQLGLGDGQSIAFRPGTGELFHAYTPWGAQRQRARTVAHQCRYGPADDCSILQL